MGCVGKSFAHAHFCHPSPAHGFYYSLVLSLSSVQVIIARATITTAAMGIVCLTTKFATEIKTVTTEPTKITAVSEHSHTLMSGGLVPGAPDRE